MESDASVSFADSSLSEREPLCAASVFSETNKAENHQHLREKRRIRIALDSVGLLWYFMMQEQRRSIVKLCVFHGRLCSCPIFGVNGF